ncbi:MAG TPA: helix-turn-helix transcriptional regulator [Candidatus Omnitrophota bacterium]|nr:helix-turn-helix transcriptional regulator [Candidatus Omnitrophota bacterium]
MIKQLSVEDHLNEELKDPYFKELWELEQQKLQVIKPIINYRIKENVSQAELARRIGVTQQHISNIENGIFSDLATVSRVLLFIGHKVQIKTIALSSTRKRQVSVSMRKEHKRTLTAKRK